jgi:hypothetical protein
MTVIAEIPYKDGVLVVADSRVTIMPKEYSDEQEFERRVSYADGQSKITKSKDGNIVTASAGSALLDVLTTAVIMENVVDLEGMSSGNTVAGVAAVKDGLTKVVDMVGSSKIFGEQNAIVLVTVKCSDGVIRPLIATMDTNNDTKPEDRVLFAQLKPASQMPEGCGFGADDIVGERLKYYVNTNCPNPSARTIEDAIAVGIMLENEYINKVTYEDTKFGKALLSTVAAPIMLVGVQRGQDVELTMSKTEMSILNKKTFAEIKEFVSNKIALKQIEVEAQKAASLALPSAEIDIAHPKPLKSIG